MESVKVPLTRVLEGLKQDAHFCNKELFSFIDRMLGVYGCKAVIMALDDDSVRFDVVEITDAAA
jgi:hypothetical protein